MRLVFVVIMVVFFGALMPPGAVAQISPYGDNGEPVRPAFPKPGAKHHHHHKSITKAAPAGPPSFAIFRDCPECAEMVMLPPGVFTMGSSDSEMGRFIDEGPRHVVSLPAFAMGKYDVTRGEFAAFVKATGWNAQGCYILNGTWYLDPTASWRNPGFSQTDRDPVVCVSWDDAQAYAQWLSIRTGKTYRLPSEAEWEYATRAGTTTARFWGDDTSNVCAYANGADQTYSHVFPQDVETDRKCIDGYAFTSPVGVLHPNPWGLYDTLGNVFQWVADCWNSNYLEAPSDGGAWQSGDCSRRVWRGGSWYSDPRNFRSAYRFKYKQGDRVSKVGFRVAMTPD